MTKPRSHESLLSSLVYLGGCRAASIAMNLVATSWLAFSLGAENFGVNTYALAFLSYFQLFVGLGYDSYLTREVAHDPTRLRPLVESAFSVRLVLAVVAMSLIAVSLFAMHETRLTTVVILIHSIGLLSTSIGLTNAYQGLRRMRIVALRECLASFLGMVGIVVLVRGAADLTIAAAVLASTSLLINLFIYVHFRREFGPVRLRLPARSDWAEVRVSLTYFWSLLMITVTYSLHIVLLGLFRNDKEVGLFGAAWKLFAFAVVVPNLISSLFMPRIANKELTSSGRRESCLLFMDTVLLSAVPITLLGAALAPWIVRLLFGPDFVTITPIVVMLMLNAMVVALNIGFGTPLVSVGRQQDFLKIVACGAALGVIINLLLIPRFGPIGAGLGTLLDEALILALFVLNRPEVPLQSTLLQLLRCLAGAIPAMVVARGVAQWTGDDPLVASVLAGGAAGGLVYIGALLMLGLDIPRVVGRLRRMA